MLQHNYWRGPIDAWPFSKILGGPGPLCCLYSLNKYIDSPRHIDPRQVPAQSKTRSQAVARIADRTAKNCRGHVTQTTPTFREIYLCACSALPIQSRVSNLKSLAQVFLKICSIVYQKLQGSRDLGHAHFQGKLFVRPLGIPDTKLHTKFEVSSSSSFRDIAL